MSLNHMMLIGNLGQDPEIRSTPSGLPLMKFSLATNESYLDREGKRQERVLRQYRGGREARTCLPRISPKGRQVFAEGQLRTREWGKGANRRRAEIVASRIQFLGPPPNDAKPDDSAEARIVAESDIPF